MRLNLARGAPEPGDLLLLDEPTNHSTSTPRVARALARAYRGHAAAGLHDLDFLDACVTHVAHIDTNR